MTYKIGYRTMKTAFGAALAILIAQSFHLTSFASAGILTILCIQATKKKSLRASWDRFLACMIAIVFSSIFFEGIAYHPLVIGLLLLFFIPTAVMVRASEGIVSSTVIILHIYTAGQVTIDLFVNELGLITIGIGMALIMNLYMPSLDNQLLSLQQKIEENFKEIFDELVLFLDQKNTNWDGHQIAETGKIIEEAKSLAFRDVENHLTREENLFYHYFKMREKQFEIIERLLPLVTSIQLSVEQGAMIARFIDDLANHIHPGNTADHFLTKLKTMRSLFEKMDLPKTREEFETRAALFQFIKEMEQYLMIKKGFKGFGSTEKRYKFRTSTAK